MLLAIDIGNTNITIGAFQGQALQSTWRISSNLDRTSDEYHMMLRSLLPLRDVEPAAIDACIICSVAPSLTPILEEAAASLFKVETIVVGPGIRTGVKVLYENPRDVGSDRVVDAAAAYHLYGGPVVVVDFGTATVFDAVSERGDYLGGAIAPGIQVAAEALVRSTSQLRRVELTRPRHAIGQNTVASLQSGLVFGYVGLVEGMVERFRREMGAQTKVVATGGQASLLGQETAIFDHVEPNLTLIGLRLVHELNINPDTV